MDNVSQFSNQWAAAALHHCDAMAKEFRAAKTQNERHKIALKIESQMKTVNLVHKAILAVAAEMIEVLEA